MFYRIVLMCISAFAALVIGAAALQPGKQDSEGTRSAWLLLAICMGFLSTGCTYLKTEVEHVSHPLAGKPFGPSTEEDALTQANVCAGKETRSGVRALWYAENCLGYKLDRSGFFGPELTYTGRVGVKFTLGARP